jgi:hypothetical protein
MNRSNPYIGPKAFQRGDSYMFCGRDFQIQKLLNLLISEQVLLLHAPSGAGKTSLINKAVIPQLEEKKFWVLPVMRVSRLLPGEMLRQVQVKNRYVFSALLALERFREDAAEAYQLTPAELTRLQELAGMTFLDYLKQVSEAQNSRPVDAAPETNELGPQTEDNAKRTKSKIVLIFDQFEEILTVDPTDHEDKIEFFRQVGDALFTEHYWALFSMREDNAASLGSLVRQLPTRLETRFRLELLTTDRAEEVIQKPAESQGVKFDSDAVQKLIVDLRTVKAQNLEGQTEEKLGEFVEPMQLQVVCYRLWENLGLTKNTDKKEITLADLKGTHVNEALAEFYEDCLQDVSRIGGKTEEEIRQWIEDELITPGETRGMVFMEQTMAAGMPKPIVKKLESRHLLRGEYRAGAHWYELTHDRFIGPIKESNRPWVALRIATKRAVRAHGLAVIWFLVLAVLWLFIEFFVTAPVNQSHLFAENNVRLAARRNALIAKESVIERVLELKKSDTNEDPTAIIKEINEVRQKIMAVDKAGRTEKRLWKGRPGKRSRKELKELLSLETAVNESVDLAATMAQLRLCLTDHWQTFRLSAHDVQIVNSLLNSFGQQLSGFRPASKGKNESANQTSQILLAYQSSAEGERIDTAKLQDGLEKIDAAQNHKQWKNLKLDQSTFEKAARVATARIFKPVEDLKKANEEELVTVNELNLNNRGIVNVTSTEILRRIQAEPRATFQETKTQISLSDRVRNYLTRLWDPTISAERAMAVIYILWCVVLTAFMIYLARAAVNLEERVGQFYDALYRVRGISDSLGWSIKSRAPSILVILALACLLSIHIRVSWLCYNIVPANSSWWRLLYIPAILAALSIAYYIVEHYRHGRIARARILEIMNSFSARLSSLRALTR